MKVIATQIKGKELEAGDLFSTADQLHWDSFANAAEIDQSRIGEKVYIRTNAPCPKDQEEVDIYRITIQK